MSVKSFSGNPAANLRVTAFIDGNGGLQSVAKNRVADLEKLQRQHGDEFQAGATVFMQGPTLADISATAKSGLRDVGSGALYAGGLLAASLGTGLAVALALPVGLPALVAGTLVAGAVSVGALSLRPVQDGLNRLSDAVDKFKSLAQGIGFLPWQGKSEFQVGGTRLREKNETQPTTQEFHKRLTSDIGPHSNSQTLHIDYVLGHGYGNQLLGGMPGMEAAQAYEKSQASSNSPRLLVLETCFGLNLATLSSMGDKGVVVGGENALTTEHSHVGRLPLTSMFEAARAHGDSPESAGKAMIEVAGKALDGKSEGAAQGNLRLTTFDSLSNQKSSVELQQGQQIESDVARQFANLLGLNIEVPKVAAISLSELNHNFVPQLGPLGSSLSAEIARGHAQKLVELGTESDLPGGGGTFQDAGAFLGKVAANQDFAPQTRLQAQQALEMLQSAKVAENQPNNLSMPLSGLSLSLLASQDGQNFTVPGQLPGPWKQFVLDLTQHVVQAQAG